MAASVLNVNPERTREIPQLERIVRAQARETVGAMKNLSNTTVASEGYRKLVDSAVTAVQSGVEDYGSAIRHAIREAGGSGLRVKYESGETRRLDTAIRMNILDGVRHLTQQVLTEVGREFGADGVEIDAHMLCAEDHLPYQGRQFSNDEFEEIQSSLARPFGEWNCRHVWHPILLGVSAPAYTEVEREEMRQYSTEEVEIDGRTKTRYEWRQEMRRCETAVRAAKDTANLAREAGDDELRRQCQRRINALNDHYTHLSNAAGLKPEYTRTYVGGFNDAGQRTLPGAEDAIRNTHTAVYYNDNATYRIEIPGQSAALNAGISTACMEVARKGSETATEHLFLIGTQSGNLEFYETNGQFGAVGYHFRSYLSEHPHESFVFVHNHNTDGSLSETDLKTLMSVEQIRIMVAVRNDGVIYAAERKGKTLSSKQIEATCEPELAPLRKLLKDGIITPAQWTKRRELAITDALLRDHTVGGRLIEYDTRR